MRASRASLTARRASHPSLALRFQLLFDYSCLLEYAKIRTVLQSASREVACYFIFTRNVCTVTKGGEPSPDRRMIKRVTIEHYDVFAKLVVE